MSTATLPHVVQPTARLIPAVVSEQTVPHQFARDHVMDTPRLVIVLNGEDAFNIIEPGPFAERVAEVAKWSDWNIKFEGARALGGGIVICYPRTTTVYDWLPTSARAVIEQLKVNSVQQMMHLNIEVHNMERKPGMVNPDWESPYDGEPARTDIIFGNPKATEIQSENVSAAEEDLARTIFNQYGVMFTMDGDFCTPLVSLRQGTVFLSADRQNVPGEIVLIHANHGEEVLSVASFHVQAQHVAPWL
jgi:hypothetical protein